MHRIDTTTAVNGQATDGDPLAGIPATEIDAAWLNDLQENVAQAIELADIALAKGQGGQLAAAIRAIAAAAAPPAAGGPAANQVAPFGMPTRAGLPGTDINGLISSGFYVAPAGTANLPAGAQGGWIVCVGNVAATGDGAMTYYDLGGPVWARTRQDGQWGAWLSLLSPQPKAQLQVNGYSWNAATGELVQWGYVQGGFAEQTVNVPFTVAFDVCFGITGHVVNPSADITVGTWIDEVSLASDAAVVLVNRVSSGATNIQGFKWVARGVRAASP